MLNISSRFGVSPGVGPRSRVVRYEPFELLFKEAGSNGVIVSVPGVSGAPEVTIDRRTLESLFSEAGLDHPVIASANGSRHVQSAQETVLTGDIAWAKRLGGTLYEAVFRGGVRDAFRDSKAGRAPGQGLSLRLRMPGLADLPLLPWELLYDVETDAFLVDDPRLSVARAPEEWEKGRSPRLNLPVRILVVDATPSGCPELDVEREYELIRQAIGWRWWRLRSSRVHRATFTTLQDKLTSEQRVDVLHFIGHGERAPGSEGPSLLFEGQEGRPDIVDGARLKLLLGTSGGKLRLVVLNACETGSIAPGDVLAGLASRIVSSGIPAAVAMREPISDRAAAIFAGRFYRTLAGTGSVEAAMTDARIELKLRLGGSLEWAIPGLFLRSGRLFEPSLRWLKVASSAAAAALLASVAFWAGQRGPEPPPDGSGSVPPQLTSLPPEVEPCQGPPDLDLQFVLVRPGTFQMGWENGGDKDERPVHEVTLTRPYCIARIEITNKLWGEVMGGAVEPDELYVPKTGTRWDDAKRFVDALEKRYPGFDFRLPTEAEWEYAARAGQPTRYGFGDDPALLPQFGNCRSGGEESYEDLAAVASFDPNPWGLYDMHGNVYEWVSDWYSEYTAEPVRDPQELETGKKRVRRGGSYDNKPESCSGTARSIVKPTTKQATGFRLVMEPPASVPAPSPAP